MKFSWIFIIILAITFSFQGCSTVNGFKNDVSSFFSGFKKKESVIHKADDWIQENMW